MIYLLLAVNFEVRGAAGQRKKKHLEANRAPKGGRTKNYNFWLTKSFL